MSLADVDTQALLERRKVLDSTVMNLAMSGVAVPWEVEEEFVAVQDELARRGERKPIARVQDWTDWLGKTVGNFKIQHLIEEGLYWYLFQASGPSSSNAGGGSSGPDGNDVSGSGAAQAADGPVAIKIAKAAALYGNESRTMKFPTRLFAIAGDIVREVQPAQNVLVDAEITRLVGTTSSVLPVIAEQGGAGGCRYYRYPNPDGETLAEKLAQIQAKEDAVDVISLISLVAGCMCGLLDDPSFVYHGNLKPENIIFTASGITFREPGNFCSMLCDGTLEPEVRVATPQYYPWLDVDDIGALGICLWDALIGYHPFDERRASAGDPILSESLRELVDLELSLSNSFILPLLCLRRPQDLGVKVAPRLEEVLFKSIKIQLGPDGLLYEDAGYESMAQFNQDLLALLSEPELLL